MENCEIYCPQCTWRPQAEDRWMCTSECGTVWNTFWTRGMCPGCAHQWHLTQCLACREHSPHRDWYHVRPAQEHGGVRTLERTA